MKIKKAYFVIFTLLVSVCIGGLVIANLLDEETKKDESNMPSEEVDAKKNNRTANVGVGETLRSQDEYDSYAQNLNSALLGKIQEKNFDWNMKSYIPIIISLSPGESLISVSLSEGNVAELTVMSAAKGCIYAQVQSVQYAFVEVPKDFEGPLNSEASVVLQDNPNTCPF